MLPDGKFDFQHFLDARRLYLSFIWDEVPHQLALALVCLAVVFFVRAVGSGGRTAAPWAVVLAASAMLANAFGGTTLVMVLACLLVTVDEGKPRRNFLIAVCTGVFAYLLVSPFLPPSLLGAIRANAELYPESAWTWSSLGGLLAVVFGGIVLGAVSRTWRPWYLRFFLLLAYVMTAIPALHQLRDVHFIPQAGRYKVEMELALVLLLVFAAALVVDRLPKAVRIALAVALIWPAAGQLISIRRFSKRVLKPVNIAGTIEFRTAQWLQNNLPGQRVMAPGSIALWMNAFSEVPQFTGGSYPTAPSSVPQRILWELFPGIEDATGRVAATVEWLNAYGVDALIVPGPKSPEFWKPFRNPRHFDQSLPLLWRERDTSIYQVPRIRRGLVHVVPEAATVKQPPRGIGDLDLIARYTAALDDPGGIPAVTTWTQDGRARIRANMPSGYVLSVQMTYHPGWKARANGNPVPIERDGLDQMVLKPACIGPCEVDLSYAGGWESWLCRAASLLTLVAGCVTVLGKIRGHRGR